MSGTSNWKDRQVLVTGSSGFIGQAVCREFLGAGATVHGARRSRPSPPGVHDHVFELNQPESFDRICQEVGPDLIVHLASPVDPERNPTDPDTIQNAILSGTTHIAKRCAQERIRLVITGTCEEYGDGPAPFDESQVPQPVSPYSQAKAESTRAVMAMVENDGLQATVLRPFLTYGPGQTSNRLIPTAIRAALGNAAFPMTDGEQTREFTHIEDMARGIVSTCVPATLGRILNLGSGDEHRVRDVVQRIFELCGSDPNLVQYGAIDRRVGENPRFVGNHSQARFLLDFSPSIPLDSGLRDTIEFWRSGEHAAG